jgi:hypothetical protein
MGSGAVVQSRRMRAHLVRLDSGAGVGFPSPMAILLTLCVVLSACTASPSERPRDGSTGVARETPLPDEATEPSSVTNVTIRFIDDAELAATVTAQAQATVPPTLIPPAVQESRPEKPVALAAAASPGALNGRTPGWRIARTDRQGVLLRANPSLGAAVVTSVAEGALVDPIEGPVASEGVSWILVQASGSRRGWVEDRYLEPPPIPTLAPVSSPGSAGTFVIGQTDGAGANVRESPSTGAPVLGNLAEGTIVEPLEEPVSSEGRAWRRVRSGSLEGWVVAVVVRPR